MASEERVLRRYLREAGLSATAIDAAWPRWWSEEASQSPSAATELRFTLARRLGLSPVSLLEDAARFVWRDEAKYKNLGDIDDNELGVLTSFGVAVGQHLIAATDDFHRLPSSAEELRDAILASAPSVTLIDLVSFCWGVGVPVIQLRLFPLQQKRMEAMTIRVGGRFAVLLGHETPFAAKAAYTLAHEIGHAVLAHTGAAAALLDALDPFAVTDLDDEEESANAFALEVLTGSPSPRIEADIEEFTATQLASAAMDLAERVGIDAGVLALCLGHQTGRWQQAFGSLKLIPPGPMDVGSQLNGYARDQIANSTMSLDSREYLDEVMGHTTAS